MVASTSANSPPGGAVDHEGEAEAQADAILLCRVSVWWMVAVIACNVLAFSSSGWAGGSPMDVWGFALEIVGFLAHLFIVFFPIIGLARYLIQRLWYGRLRGVKWFMSSFVVPLLCAVVAAGVQWAHILFCQALFRESLRHG